jgi:hypothetical protein
LLVDVDLPRGLSLCLSLCLSPGGVLLCPDYDQVLAVSKLDPIGGPALVHDLLDRDCVTVQSLLAGVQSDEARILLNVVGHPRSSRDHRPGDKEDNHRERGCVKTSEAVSHRALLPNQSGDPVPRGARALPRHV